VAVIKLQVSGKHGFDMAEDLDIRTLGTYDHISHSSTQAKFYDSSTNFTSFSGSGFKYQFSGGFLTDIKGGTISTMKVMDHGVTTISVSHLHASAARAYDFYTANQPTEAVDYFLKGNDTITATRLDDSIRAGMGRDKVTAGAGNDTVWGDGGNDVINGGDGKDYVDGGGGRDLLKAGLGNDKLVGGAGNDVLTGQGGADMFIFSGFYPSDIGRDTITDFSRAQHDKISLAGIDANHSLFDDQAFRFMGTQAFSGYAGEVRYQIKGHDTYVLLDMDGGGTAEITIHLDGAHALNASDFIL
jgi:Ca2+-binding RTX toxin-like protein